MAEWDEYSPKFMFRTSMLPGVVFRRFNNIFRKPLLKINPRLLLRHPPLIIPILTFNETGRTSNSKESVSNQECIRTFLIRQRKVETCHNLRFGDESGVQIDTWTRHYGPIRRSQLLRWVTQLRKYQCSYLSEELFSRVVNAYSESPDGVEYNYPVVHPSGRLFRSSGWTGFKNPPAIDLIIIKMSKVEGSKEKKKGAEGKDPKKRGWEKLQDDKDNIHLSKRFKFL